MTRTIKKKAVSLKEFKKFLAENCYDNDKYGMGEYDAKIYNFFKPWLI